MIKITTKLVFKSSRHCVLRFGLVAAATVFAGLLGEVNSQFFTPSFRAELLLWLHSFVVSFKVQVAL